MLVMLTTLAAKEPYEYYKEIGELTIEQKEVMLRAYVTGSKTNYGYTLTAIAWKESEFGKFKMNTYDGHNLKYVGSYGVYHILLNTAMGREKNKSNWRASRIAERLYEDDDYCAEKALVELRFWERSWKNKGVGKQYSHTIASYNAGYNSLNSSSGREYASDILNRVRALKKYFKVHNIDELLK